MVRNSAVTFLKPQLEKTPKIETISPLTIHDVIKPVYYTLRFTTLWPYKYQPSGKIQPLTATNKSFACILVITITSYYFYSSYFRLKLFFDEKYPILCVSDVLYSLSSHILCTVSIWNSNTAKPGCLTRDFLLHIEKIRRTDISCTEQLRNNVLRETVAIIFAGTTFILFNVIISFVVIGSNDFRNFLSTYVVQFYVMFLFLKINMKVEILLRYFRGVNNRLGECECSQTKVRELSQIHSNLGDLIDLTNEGHGWEMVLFIIATASKILNSLHLGIIHGFKLLFRAELQTTMRFAQITTSTFYCGLTIILAAKCSRAKKEARKTGILANDMLLKIPVNDRNAHVLLYRKELKLLVSHISYRQPNFCAAGLFNVDYTVISTVFGVITSYFIVLLQF